MIKSLTLVALMVLRLSYHPAPDAAQARPFAAPVRQHATSLQLRLMQPAKLVSFSANLNGKKVMLQWEISQNETADLFEVQKSADGKNFSMAALVFGTDRNEMGSYAFYEKAAGKKTCYRIKVIGKDKQVSFSDIVIVKPVAS